MKLRSVVGIVLSALLIGSLAGCGGDDELFPNESETTKAIRMKVRADMEKDRVKRLGRSLAHATEAAASAPSATKLVKLPAAAMEESLSAGEADAGPGPTGEELYAANCASCHGAQGGGDGLLSAGLNPKPTRHSDGAYMNSLSNDHLMKVVKLGGAAVGKSALMAPWGGTMSDDQIRSVITFMRSLAEPAYEGEAI